MWKKISIAFLSFVATGIVVCAMNQNLFAESSSYQSGGNLTGRIQMAPADLTSDKIGFQKGDRILTGITNPKNSNLMSWQLILKETYTDYGCTGNSACNQPSLTGFISIADESIAETYYGLTTADFNGTYANSAKSNVYINHILPFNRSISTQDRKVITYRNLQYLHEFISPDDIGFMNNAYLLAMNWNGAREGGQAGLNIKNKDLKFEKEYWNQVSGNDGGWSRYVNYTINTDGNGGAGMEGAGAYNAIENSYIKAVRPCLTFDLSNVVFGLSHTSTNGLATVSEYKLDPDYTDIRTAEGAAMKLRLYNSTMTAHLNDLKKMDGTSSTMFAENQSMKLSVNANSATDENGNPYTVSAMVFSETGDFVYYRPLKAASGNDDYIFDLSGILPGNYKIGVVNEAYNDTNAAPKDSSAISNLLDVEILEGPKLTYTPVYSGSPQTTDTYEYSINVKKGDTIGELQVEKGANPIALSLIHDESAGASHASDYQNFSISKNTENAPSSDPILIQVAENAPDVSGESLKAKDYYFKIQAVDMVGISKDFSVHITVNQNKPTITFNQTAQLDVKIGETFDGIQNVVNPSNTDDLTNKVEYQLEGGISNVLNVLPNSMNPKQYDLQVAQTHSGVGLPTTFQLTAKTKATENYKESDVATRTILVYKELSTLKWTADKDQYSPSDCVSGKKIGTLLAENGVGPFTYELQPSSATNDNSSFSVISTPTSAGTSVNVITRSSLLAGSYTLEFKVTDKTNKTLTTSTQIRVQADAQTGFVWKDVSTGTQINQADVEYGSINKKIFAEGGQSGLPVVYAVAPQDLQPSDISDASAYVSIDPNSGLLTLKKAGTVKVMATLPGNSSFAESKIYMNLVIKQGTQSIAFKPSTVSKVQIDKSATIDAEGSVVLGGATGIGGIWYDSSDRSIATVDANTGVVTGIRAGSITLSAVLNKANSGDYTNPNYNPNYETKTITKQISIYKPMTFTYADHNPKVKANANAVGDSVGSITVSDKFGSAPLTATISSSTGIENADREYFADNPFVNGNVITLKLKKTIDAEAYVAHNGGTFRVQVVITDGNGPQTYDVPPIIIDEADNEVHFTSTEGAVISSLKRMYDDTENKFTLTSKSDSNSSSESVRYSAVDTSQDILDIKANGDVNVLKAGSTLVKVNVGASNGYGEAETQMLVTINPATQIISFTDTTDPIKVELNGSSKTLVTVAKVVLSDGTEKVGVGDITYESSNPAIASIDQSGVVTAVAVGPQVEIKAKINALDSANYNPNYETKDCTKKVQVFTGKSIIFAKKTPNLKANTEIKKQIVGVISAQNTSGAITYEKVNGGDSALFEIVNNGQSADVKFKNDAPMITANELFLHGSEYTFQVNVIDDNGSTPCEVTITIDDADDEIVFKKDDAILSKISETYGVNNNAITITAVPKSGKAPTYAIVGDNSIIEIPNSAIGKATIKKVGTTKIQVSIPAGKGYAALTTSIDVEVLAGEQWITFANSETTHAFSKDGTFSAVANLSEVSESNVSARLLSYKTMPTSVCTIDAAGTITMKTTGLCTITAENKDANWIAKSAEKTITLYDGIGVDFNQDKALQAETSSANTGALVGTLKATGGIAPIKYGISTNTGADNGDAGLFKVNQNTGVVSLNHAITAAELNGKYDETKQAYVLHVIFTATDKDGAIATASAKEVLIKGTPLTDVKIDTEGKSKISKVYVEKDGEFPLDVLNYHGTGAIRYQLKQQAGMPQDVIAIENGIVSILNANEQGKDPVIVEAIIPPSDGYDTKTLECEVEITRATQPFRFKKDMLDISLKSEVDLEVENIKAKDAEGNLLDWSMISRETGKLKVQGHKVLSESSEGEVTVVASVGEDRNYEAATDEMIINITSKPAYLFEITVPEVTYGDAYDETHPLKPIIFVDKGVGEKTRAWKSSNPSVASIDEQGHITIIKAGETTISCVQTIVGQPSVSSSAVLTINKKAITVTIDNAEKYVGENVPTFHASIPSDEVVGNDVIGQPIFTCKDGINPITPNTKVGSYDITASYPSGLNPNYTISVIPANLTIKQDTSLASWYHLEGATSKEVLDGSKWYNEDVNIILDEAIADAGTYDEISLDKVLWDKAERTISAEGEQSKDVYFRISASDVTHPLALSTPQTIGINIDKTKPVVKSITGTPTNKDAISTLLNQITFGLFFKPGTQVNIKSEDPLPSANTKVSGLKEVRYEVMKIDPQSKVMESTPIDQGTKIPNKDGEVEVVLNDVGYYRVCATTFDQAGNESGEKCSDLNVKKIDVDIDDDGENEFQDPGNDGCPDINIALQDEEGVIYKINVDRNGDNIPDLDIDSDKDGIADINIDSDGDKKPDLNLVVLDTWTPTACITDKVDDEGKEFSYCTMEDIKAEINVSAKGTKIPRINIDTTGDMKADINIAKDGVTATLNLLLDKDIVWAPEKDYPFEQFPYDTMDSLIPQLDIDYNDDGYPDVNVDTNQDGLPDLNITIDGDLKPETNIDGNGDGLPDINIDSDGDGVIEGETTTIKEWKPDAIHSINGKKFGTMLLSNEKKDILEDKGVQVERPGQAFLPNFSIRVNSVLDTISEEVKRDINNFVGNGMEIKEVFDVQLYDGENQIQPDGSYRVKIPMKEEWRLLKNLKVVIEQASGKFKEVDATIVDGYIIYESDFLGKVSIIGDKVQSDVKVPDFSDSVKGEYTQGGIGGAGTGDEKNVSANLYTVMLTACFLGVLYGKRKRRDE